MSSKLAQEVFNPSEVFARLADTVPCGLYEYTLTLENEGHFHYMNTRGFEIFDISSNELSDFGKNIWGLFDAEDANTIAQLSEKSNLTGVPFFFEGRITTQLNNTKWIRMSSHPSTTFYNGCLIWSGYILDISHEKRLVKENIEKNLELSLAIEKVIRYEELEKLNTQLHEALEEKNLLLRTMAAYAKANEMGSLIGSLVHEINNPLGAININTQSLEFEIDSIQKSGLTPSSMNSLKDISQGLIRSNRSLSKVIANLRNLFIMGRLEFEVFDFSQMVENICELVAREIRASEIEFCKQIKEKIHIYGDQGQLQMVVLNSINNAIDAVKNHKGLKKINLSLTEEDGRLCFEIQDSGVGFQQDSLQKAFELFHTTKANGMGIGLWLSRSIVENHNGTITLSNAPNGGAVVRIEMSVNQ
ncbi:PAS domain-containing sensor histidine kinase [Hydromonas duriensis]|uniref:histidine kinase n=1 Tax=Hydromonas duriensis TaxID=1527608 RepID=A0A4R6Y5L9_9BURK|nr:PAS domain-containing sensor histidine kinase [Hydromonas duriensis]TDR30413.1 signal transduction histidine kinase [Hydromonas duriensis]